MAKGFLFANKGYARRDAASAREKIG